MFVNVEMVVVTFYVVDKPMNKLLQEYTTDTEDSSDISYLLDQFLWSIVRLFVRL